MGSSNSRPANTENRPSAQARPPQYATNSAQPNGAGPYSGYTFVNQYRPQTQQYPQQQFGTFNYNTYPPAPVQPNIQPQPPQPLSNPVPPPEKQKTKTIRNDVNLKKHTLKLTVDPEDPHLYYPSFSFDGAAPCSVSIFYNVTENPNDSLSLKCQNPGTRIHYDKKIGATFPPEKFGKDELKVHAFMPHLYDESQLSNCRKEADGSEVWPLCVRLECVTPAESLEMHTLDSIPVGGPMPSWVQSQTTYACLKKTEHGYTVKVLKQKIWVDEAAYELQEIYGLENAITSEKNNDDIGRECVICMSEPRDTTLLPCRHMCLCHDCAKMLRTQTNKCPICRTQVQSLLEITVKT